MTCYEDLVYRGLIKDMTNNEDFIEKLIFPIFFLKARKSALSYIFIANIMFLDEDCHKNVNIKLDKRTRNGRTIHLLRQGGAVRLSLHVKRNPSK